MNTQELQDKVIYIFQDYKQTYSFNDRLVFTDNSYDMAGVDHNNEILVLNISALSEFFADADNKDYIKSRFGLWIINKEKFIIGVLLHEICHIIDRYYDYKTFKSEHDAVDYYLYSCNREYHNTRPFEVRADNFAKQELKKWV